MTFKNIHTQYRSLIHPTEFDVPRNESLERDPHHFDDPRRAVGVKGTRGASNYNLYGRMSSMDGIGNHSCSGKLCLCLLTIKRIIRGKKECVSHRIGVGTTFITKTFYRLKLTQMVELKMQLEDIYISGRIYETKQFVMENACVVQQEA